MAMAFTYTYYACPCSDLTASRQEPSDAKDEQKEQDHESAFNPHDPRANYALQPLDVLLFCDECHELRCPRCWMEEVMETYCPACLFEVPSSAVKSDGNRCSRNCYNCPLCQAPMVITTSTNSNADDDRLKPSNAASTESYILQCQYCDWSTLDIDVRFAKPTKITEQLARLRKARTARLPLPDKHRPDGDGLRSETTSPSHEDAFTSLATFYREQLSETGDSRTGYSSSPYSSPANLARIMTLYGGLSHTALRKSREKPQPMREARGPEEGFSEYTANRPDAEIDVINKMHAMDWEGTTTAEQRLSTSSNNGVHFTDQLWPIATPLRTRRGKRCKVCRQFLARPDAKVGNLRYKIRLLAQNHIPRLSIRPLQLSEQPASSPAFRLRNDEEQPTFLRPHVTQHYLLTVRNPVFETIRITLATPATTPGRISSRVTILCPSFDVGPTGEVWDEALSSSVGSAANDGSRTAAMATLTGAASGAAPADRQPEAGKIWSRTRNSTSVVVEIVPGPLKPPPSIVPATGTRDVDVELGADEDVLEVPVYLRAEWEADDRDRGGLEKAHREVAYWCVLGVGRIAG